MSEPQPSKSPETNAGEKPATAGGGMASVAAVGARLAELRRTKGWSVDDVSARLKVAAPKLQALEAGDTSQLPGTTFALGLVRSYAKMLGVDPEPFAQALRREKGVPEVDLSMPASAGTDLPRGRVSIPLGGASRGRPWLWAVAAVVVALKVAQDCWFSVRDKNGKELFSALVRAGETRQVAGDAPLKVTIGNKAGLESVAFDGKPVDPAKYSTARGNVARFALP